MKPMKYKTGICQGIKTLSYHGHSSFEFVSLINFGLKNSNINVLLIAASRGAVYQYTYVTAMYLKCHLFF